MEGIALPSGGFVKTLVRCALLMMSLTLFGQQAPPPPPPPPPPQAPQRIGGDVAQANLLVQVKPEYPPLARAARVQDYVMLQATISKDGKVTSLNVLRGHPLLNEAALAAVRQWQYKPQTLNGQVIEVVTTITVNFSFQPAPNVNAPRLPSGNASITGKLRHADGRPATAVFVFAAVAGEGELETRAISALVQTDGTGAYRIENLPPGTYHIHAGTGPFTLYPGVAVAKDAVAVTIASGQTTLVGIDFPLP
jgi:TonB family protein